MKSRLAITLLMLIVISCSTTPTPVVEPSKPPEVTPTEVLGNMTSTGFYWPTGTSDLGSYAGWLASGCDGATAYSVGYYHIGYDIAAELGAPVFAIADGIVIDISSNGWSPDTMPDIGNVGVLVQHWLSDGTPFIAIYGHVQTEAGVTYRSELSAGEKFAEIGPWSPPHLHFAISPGMTAQAPYGAVRCPETDGALDPNGYVNPIEWITTRYPGAHSSQATATPPPAPTATTSPSPAPTATTSPSPQSSPGEPPLYAHLGGKLQAFDIDGGYLYLAQGTSMSILDAKDEIAPVQSRIVDPQTELIKAIHVRGSYAYTTAGSDGFRVYDVSDSRNPVAIGYCDGFHNATEFAFYTEYAYVLDGPRLQVVDISTPQAPVILATVDTQHSYEGLRTLGQHAYAYGSGGVYVYTIADSLHPTLLAVVDGSGETLEGFDVDDSYAYLVYNDGLSIIDLTSLPETEELLWYPLADYPYLIEVVNNLAHVATHEDELLLYDLANREQPILLGKYASAISSGFKSLNIANGIVYIVDDYDNLEVIDASNPANPILIKHADILGDVFEASSVGDSLYISSRDHLWEYSFLNVMSPEPIGMMDFPLSYSSWTVQGDNLYYVGRIGAPNFSQGWFQIIDISDINHPLINAPIYSNQCAYSGITLSENIAYLFGISPDYKSCLAVYNIAIPESPSPVAFYPDFQPRISNFTVSGNYGYITAGMYGFAVADLTDIGNITIISLNQQHEVANIMVDNTYAYLETYSDGIWIYDITSPEEPQYVGHALAYFLNGCSLWGNYIYCNQPNEPSWYVFDVSEHSEPFYTAIYYNRPTKYGGFEATGKVVLQSNRSGGLYILGHYGALAPSDPH